MTSSPYTFLLKYIEFDTKEIAVRGRKSYDGPEKIPLTIYWAAEFNG